MNEPSKPDSIQAALAAFDDITVRPDTIQAFLKFLLTNINLPCEVVTAGEFERYRLEDIEDSNDELFGLLGCVKLLSDEKKGTKIPLCDLKAADNRSRNFELLNDYATWFVQYQ